MMSSTFGAPLGGTTRGGHQGLESVALSLITPPNFAGGGGSCFPSIVVVALGEPGVPVICCAVACRYVSVATAKVTARNVVRCNPFMSTPINCDFVSAVPIRGVANLELFGDRQLIHPY